MLLKKIDKKICYLKGKLAFKENAKKDLEYYEGFIRQA